jgi:hypothetical protein
LWPSTNDGWAIELLASHKPLTPTAVGTLYMQLMQNHSSRVTDSAAGGTQSRPNTELWLIRKRAFPANIPVQVEGGVISDIMTGREVQIHRHPLPGNVNTNFKKCITFDA